MSDEQKPETSENNVISFEDHKRRRDEVQNLVEDSMKPDGEVQDFVKAYAELMKILEERDQIIAGLIHDQNILIQRNEQLEVAILTSGFNMFALLQTLIQKNLITLADYQTIWAKDVAPKLREMGLIPEDTSQIVVPKPNLIIPQ